MGDVIVGEVQNLPDDELIVSKCVAQFVQDLLLTWMP